MYLWPSSATLSEDGGAQPSGGGSTFGGGAKGPGGGSAVMGPANAGEIMLSRAETAALAALETEPDAKHGLRRARAESGLSEQQIKMLQRRAEHALSKGITLKGVGFTRKPTPGAPEEPSLVKKAQKDNQAVVEALRAQQDKSAYSLPSHSDYRLPAPASMGESDGPDSVQSIDQTFLPRTTACATDDEDDVEETNSGTTFSRLAAANRKRRTRKY